MVTKCVILGLVFPVLVSVIHILFFPILLTLSPILSLFGTWSQTVINYTSIASLVFAAAGAAIITRWIWQKQAR